MSEPAHTIVVPAWANGPDGSGNGGWTAGMLAEQVAALGSDTGTDADAVAVAVDLRRPPPLARPLRVEQGIDDGLTLLDDEQLDDAGEPRLVARATPTGMAWEVPDEVGRLDADAGRRASAGFPFRDSHPFPNCLSCGTRRPAGMPALCIHCGPVEGLTVADATGKATQVFADAWTPTPDLADPRDPSLAALPACWAALDCPSSTPFADPAAANPVVLARFVVRLSARARIGEPHVLAAWALRVDGRKHHSRSVLLDSGGAALGIAQALWIEVRGA